MIFQEYGNDQKDTILLLHGGGLSWWNYREEAEILQGEFSINHADQYANAIRKIVKGEKL